MKKALAATFVFATLLGLVIYASASFIAVSLFKKPELKDVIESFSPALPAVALYTLVGIGLQGFHRIVWSVFTLHIGVVFFFLPFLLILDTKSATDAAFHYSISAVIVLAIGYVIWRKSANDIDDPKSIEWEVMRSSFLPLWIFTVMSSLSQWASQLIAGVFVSSEEIAWVAVAQRTSLLTSIVLMAVNMVVAPRFAALYRAGQAKELQGLAINSVKVMLLISIPVASMLFAYAEYVMSIFGDEFRQGAVLLRVYIVGQLVNVATGSVAFLLSMTGHERDLRNNAIISAIVTVLLSFILIPVMGVKGSAYSTAIAVSVQNLLSVYWVKKRLGFNTLAVWRQQNT